MHGRELLKKAFALEELERVPWVPFVGCHGGKLIGANAADYLQSSDLLIKGVSKAIELYQPDGIPVMFDLQVEAEALGCQLAWSPNNPPAVVSHILQNGISINDLKVPERDAGRIAVGLDAAKALRMAFPEIGLYGLITGPFTLGLHLMGTDIFMKMMEEPDEVHRLLEFTARVGMAMANYYIESGCDIIAVVDPMTSQIDPVSFETFIHKPASAIFERVRSQGKLSSFFVCGHAQQNIEAMCACNPDNISVDENIPLEFVRDAALKHGISFGGNMKLTVVLLMGTPEDAQRDALDCMDAGGNRGFILAPGCDLPMDTPPENIQAVTALVHDDYLQKVVRAREKSESGLELLNMKDYGRANKVIIDIITLDSESCAPCQYMVEAVKRVAPHFEGIVEWREHAIKKMEAVTFMNSLMVKNIPTICIDGKIEFVSQIPPHKELVAAIQRRINQKFKTIVSSRKAEMIILGQSEEECEQARKNIETAILETGKTIPVRVSCDKSLHLIYGISSTPAIILTEHKIKCQGEIPKVEIIKEWLKDV